MDYAHDYANYKQMGWAQHRPYKRPPSRYYYTSGKARTKKRKMSRGYFGSETKFSDAELTSTALSTAWQTLNPTTLDSLTSVAQGTTESTHLGRTMYMTSLHLRGEFFVSVSEADPAPSPDAVCRFAIVLDTETKADEATATEVFDAGQTSDRFAFRNLQHTSRLRVYHDKTMVIRPDVMNEGGINSFANSTRTHYFKVNLKFKKPIRVLFTGTTAVVGSIVDNSFHFVAVASSALVSVSYQVRLRFKDTI